MINYITDINQITGFQKELEKATNICLDIETNGLDPFVNDWRLLQLKVNNEIFIFDIQKLGNKYAVYIIQLLASTDKMCIGHNIKFDLEFIKVNTGVLLTNLFDVQLAEILINNGIAKGKERYPTYESLVTKYFPGAVLNKSIRDLFETSEVITEEMITYSADDVLYLDSISFRQILKLREQKQDKVSELEFRLIPVVVEMELNGVLLDDTAWMKMFDDTNEEAKKLRIELTKELIEKVIESSTFKNALAAVEFLGVVSKTKLTKSTTATLESITDINAIKDYLIDNFNLRSSQQLLIILRDIYKIADYKGRPLDSTNEKIINKYAGKHPIIDKIISYREKNKSTTSFGENFISAISPVTGRIHTNLNQLGAQSGRFSSSNPNLLNIPKDNRFRNCFIAREGCAIIALDFNQEELRLIAAQSGDKNMIQAYMDGVDLHTRTAALIYEKPDKEISKAERYDGKQINFTVGYDGTASALYKNAGIPLEKGEKLIWAFYNKAYTGLRDYKEELGKVIWEKCYSKTPLGRKRFFEKKIAFDSIFEAENFRAKTIRELENHALGQGPGADVIKESLCRIFFENPFGERVKILLQIYDEILIETPIEIKDDVASFAKRIMEEAESKYLNGIPAVVDVTIDTKWTKE